MLLAQVDMYELFATAIIDAGMAVLFIWLLDRQNKRFHELLMFTIKEHHAEQQTETE